MPIAERVLVQISIKTDVAFQLPEFFLRGVDLLVEGLLRFVICLETIYDSVFGYLTYRFDLLSLISLYIRLFL